MINEIALAEIGKDFLSSYNTSPLPTIGKVDGCANIETQFAGYGKHFIQEDILSYYRGIVDWNVVIGLNVFPLPVWNFFRLLKEK